jgi:hypothetical protein
MQASACMFAGIAQLVERNLAKVEVESSRLFSRSKFQKGKLKLPFFVKVDGAIANRLCNGLQIRLAQFDSGSRLQEFWLNSARKGLVSRTAEAFLLQDSNPARVVKLVDTSDLKSAAS